MNERVKRALRRDLRAWFGVGVVVLIVLLAVLNSEAFVDRVPLGVGGAGSFAANAQAHARSVIASGRIDNTAERPRGSGRITSSLRCGSLAGPARSCVSHPPNRSRAGQ